MFAISQKKQVMVGILMMLALLAFAFQRLCFYLLLDSNLLMALVLAPFIIAIEPQRKGRMIYGFLSVICCALWVYTSLQSFFFFGFVFGIYFITERTIGRLNSAAFFLALLCSPLSTYGFKVFGFPIRLYLTELATKALSWAGYSASSMGNSILLSGDEFVVEPACTGLKMVISGLLITLLLVRTHEKRTGKTVSALVLCATMAIGFILIVLSNLIRLVGLMIFAFPEASFGHEFVGILALAVYTVLPLMWLVPRIVRKFAKENHGGAERKHFTLNTILMLAVVIIIPYSSMQPSSILTHASLENAPVIHGYDQQPANFDGFKYSNQNALLYVKPCLDFWRSDHNPIICWRGSGYRFSKEREEKIAGHRIYTATLLKGEDVIHTAWWFQNATDVTVDQVSWRWEMANGADRYDLINVSCSSRKELLTEAERLLNLSSREKSPTSLSAK